MTSLFSISDQCLDNLSVDSLVQQSSICNDISEVRRMGAQPQDTSGRPPTLSLSALDQCLDNLSVDSSLQQRSACNDVSQLKSRGTWLKDPSARSPTSFLDTFSQCLDDLLVDSSIKQPSVCSDIVEVRSAGAWPKDTSGRSSPSLLNTFDQCLDNISMDSLVCSDIAEVKSVGAWPKDTSGRASALLLNTLNQCLDNLPVQSSGPQPSVCNGSVDWKSVGASKNPPEMSSIALLNSLDQCLDNLSVHSSLKQRSVCNDIAEVKSAESWPKDASVTSTSKLAYHSDSGVLRQCCIEETRDELDRRHTAKVAEFHLASACSDSSKVNTDLSFVQPQESMQERHPSNTLITRQIGPHGSEIQSKLTQETLASLDPLDLVGVWSGWKHVTSDRVGTQDVILEDACQDEDKHVSEKRPAIFNVNTSACGGKSAKDLFSLVASYLGWREIFQESRCSIGAPAAIRKPAKATIYCVMQTSDMLDRLPVLGSSNSWATRYIGFPDLCEKGSFARLVRACEDFCDKGYFSFIPRTWIVPEQLAEVRKVLTKSRNTFIVKPENGSQGDGIFLVQSAKDLDIKLSTKRSKSAIVQKYIEKPLLLQNLKFDLRLYVCVIGGSLQEPPRVFVCREGLARFCTETYEEPTTKNKDKSMAHLTNYSLNKRSDKFEHSAETLHTLADVQCVSSKRPLSTTLNQIEVEYPSFNREQFYERIVTLTTRTIAVMTPALIAYHRQHADETNLDEMRSMQVLGFDVMLDKDFVPYLLEVNNSPSLCIDEAFALEPGEPGSDEKGGRPGRPREKDKVCLCMDMAQPHRHQISLVDLVVKTTVMSGAFILLEQIQQGTSTPEVDCYIAADVAEEPAYAFFKVVEQLFHRCGGPQKAFSSTGLRRTFGPLIDGNLGKGLEKHDLDAISQRFKGTKFVSHDRLAKSEALRLFDFVELLRHIGARTHPNIDPSQAVMKILAALG